jgi:hypothetical protein
MIDIQNENDESFEGKIQNQDEFVENNAVAFPSDNLVGFGLG